MPMTLADANAATPSFDNELGCVSRVTFVRRHMTHVQTFIVLQRVTVQTACDKAFATKSSDDRGAETRRQTNLITIVAFRRPISSTWRKIKR